MPHAQTLIPMTETEDMLVLSPELAGTLMTPEEFDSARDCEDGYVYEVVNGVLVVSPPPLIGERGPNELLGYLLRDYQERHPLGKALDYTVPEHRVRTRRSRRRADRAIWAGLGRLPSEARDLPTIVVELVSAGRRSRKRDYEVKREEYLEAGIAEYWIVDRFRRTLTVARRGEADLVVQESEAYTTPLLPGFALPLGRLLAEADMLDQAAGAPE